MRVPDQHNTMAIYQRPVVDLSKFDNCTIVYKSGDDESWIDYIVKDKKRMEYTDTEREELEHKYDFLISAHDHDRNNGRGVIVIVNGRIEKESYQEDDD